MLLLDAPQLKPIAWRAVVVDEAHRLKNRASALYRCLLDELQLGGTPRLLLTGTPLQNNLTELWSLLNFLLPSIFDDLESFQVRRDSRDSRDSRASRDNRASRDSRDSRDSPPTHRTTQLTTP